MNTSIFSGFTNQYELSKTLRFELKASENFTPDLKKGDIQKLLSQFQNIQDFFLDIFVYKNDFEKEKKITFKKGRKIKYGWLRNNTKHSFYDRSESLLEEKNKELREKHKQEITIKGLDTKPYLTSIDYLPKEFLRWVNEWQDLRSQLDKFVNTKEKEQERRSEIAFVLRRFLKRQNFLFIQSFANSVMDLQNSKGIDDDHEIQKLRILLSDTYINLKSCEQEYLPSQSGGVLLHKASLNYYTLNKDPKEEYKKLKSEKEKEMKYNLPRYIYNREKNRNVKFKCSDSWLISIGIGISFKRKSLDDVYSDLKNWKAEQKSKFNEAVAGDKLSVSNFREKFPLFDTSDENFEVFYELTKELDNLEGNDAKEKAKERGSFFNKPTETIQTKNYYEFCELFKRVALKRGQIIAKIKGIENEEVQSQMLDSWAVITEEKNKKSVIFIPRENKKDEIKNDKLGNHGNAHSFIESNFDKNKTEGEITLYHFKSLTLRALEKLCFKEIKNTFAPELRKEGIQFPRYKEEGRAENKEQYEKKMIKFYQDILKSNYAKQYLDLVDFGGLQKVLDETDFENLQEFETALEKVCYVKVPLKISEEQKNEFINDFDAKEFEMTTRSIAGKKKENRHSEILKDFWSNENRENNHIIRLNPEMSIFYRETISDKSNEERENNKTSITNRYSKPRFTLATTVSLNALSEKSNLAFKTTQDIKNHIEKFNGEFNEKFDGEWVYGIDRGIKELATLNVVKFSDEKNEFGVSKSKEFAKIPVYKLRDENAVLKKNGEIVKNAKGEERKIIDNISAVLKKGEPDDNLFKKDTVSSIDLTQAKLIKGHIILNGDQKTYLKLKELSAKRRIFELVISRKINKNSEITGKKTLIIGGVSFYWLLEWQRQDTWKNEREELKKRLTEYKNKIIDNLSISKEFPFDEIEKINHLRDAITANMVGILFYLQTKLKMPGFIGLENMDIIMKYHNDKIIDEHFQQSNEDISRRLEWSLYRKFANIGGVPPQIKESILLRDDFKTYQVGILKFVKIGGTSRGCPNCPKEWSEKCEDKNCRECEKCKENKIYGKNKLKNIYICKDVEDCKFSSKENRNTLEKNLDNSDKVAAYNVAKNAFNNLYT